MRAVKQWRADLAERQSAARELRVARNRFVLRAHERLARDAVRQKDDDRSRRMDALKVTPLLPHAGEQAAMLNLLSTLQVPRNAPDLQQGRQSWVEEACDNLMFFQMSNVLT